MRDAFFDRPHATLATQLSADWLADRDESLEFVARALRDARRGPPVEKALRLDTNVMLVDDPVKRVDNMTMAWGLEARVPFLDHELVELAARLPAELKLARRRQGHPEGRRARWWCRPRSSTGPRATSRSRR